MTNAVGTARIIARSEDGQVAFWAAGDDVFRVTGTCPGLDTYGLPMGRRWECSASHWELARESVYGWAADVVNGR